MIMSIQFCNSCLVLLPMAAVSEGLSKSLRLSRHRVVCASTSDVTANRTNFVVLFKWIYHIINLPLSLERCVYTLQYLGMQR